ncbi:hypothetical protein OHV08_48995 [Streptomyces canus]|uniref:hypothetical protein n=1 Tax=Streptomyces canus TaxID=58343 RepID=UPI00325432A4
MHFLRAGGLLLLVVLQRRQPQRHPSNGQLARQPGVPLSDHPYYPPRRVLRSIHHPLREVSSGLEASADAAALRTPDRQAKRPDR